ncbi:hypothetical protein VTN31DRAFT_462 [Thermomyces dupontii]|uniref:uncharacterized protein n=1 Tax=Talaromyces thermophilus TaxID=28565 RepID=UPI0037439A5A
MSQHWTRLRHSNNASVPPLLYKFRTTSKNYEFHVTDLTCLWSECLSLRDILQRAEDTGASIDPGEDPDQFDVLLEKIGDALRGTQGSRVAVNPGSTRDSLEIVTVTPLPKPLKPLRWTLFVSRRSPSELTRHLLLPLLKGEVERERRERVLLDRLKEKDWVIGKIFDKIDTIGVDLGALFPSVGGVRGPKKGSTFSHVAEHVKGVAPFDEAEWRRMTGSGESAVAIAADVTNQITDNAESSAIDDFQVPTDRWWESLDVTELSGDERPSASKEPSARDNGSTKRRPQRPTDIQDESTDEDEFEQATPRLPRRQKGEAEAESHSQSDMESQPTPHQSSPPARRPQAPAQKKALGKIGGFRNARPRARTASVSSTASDDEERAPPPPPPPPADRDDMTESGSPSPSPSPRRSQPVTDVPDSSTAPAPPRKKVLGTIGGKKALTPSERAPSRSASPPARRLSDASTDSDSRLTRPRALPGGKLGTIGGKRKATSGEGRDSSPTERKPQERPSPARANRDSASLPRPEAAAERKQEETTLDKADRKRQELKQQLEAQRRAAGKKRRKF